MRTELFNREAEGAVIGSCMLDPNVVFEIIDLIDSTECFYDSRNRVIWTAIKRLFDKNVPVDVLTVSGLLHSENKFEEAGGAEYITDTLNIMPTTANAKHYADIVIEKYRRRKMAKAGGDIYHAALSDERTNEELQEYIDSTILELCVKSKKGFQHVSEGLTEHFQKITSGVKPTFIKTGIEALDKILNGFSPGDLVIIAARPSMGKTTLALQIALNNALRFGKKPGIFSLEMTKEQLVNKFLSNLSQIETAKIRNCDIGKASIDRLVNAFNVIYQMPCYIDDSSYITTTEIRSKATKLTVREGLDLIIIDYLQLMDGSGSNRNQELSGVTRSLKLLAKDINIPVILLSQLSRDVEKRTNKRPILSDLRDSGAIEQDADSVIFLYGDHYYSRPKERKLFDAMNPKLKMELIAAKNRNGATGTAEAAFIKEYSRFGDFYYGEAEENE